MLTFEAIATSMIREALRRCYMRRCYMPLKPPVYLLDHFSQFTKRTAAAPLNEIKVTKFTLGQIRGRNRPNSRSILSNFPLPTKRALSSSRNVQGHCQQAAAPEEPPEDHLRGHCYLSTLAIEFHSRDQIRTQFGHLNYN